MAGGVAAWPTFSCTDCWRHVFFYPALPRQGFFRNRAAEKEIRKELKLLLILDNPFIIKHAGCTGAWSWTNVPGACGACVSMKFRFREWFEDPCSGIFFVMELCTGPSLQNILEDRTVL